jgi:hypothetical protein
MQANEHTNLLSIFAWVYAALQGVFVVFYLLFGLLYGGIGIAMAFSAKRSDAAGLIIFGVIVALFVVICVFGLICMIANIRMGKQLRSNVPPTQRAMKVTSILNFLSWFCGGIFLMPFGIALGAYGLWFTLSDLGKAYLAGQVFSPGHFYPPNPQAYQVNEALNVKQPTEPEPYKWQ